MKLRLRTILTPVLLCLIPSSLWADEPFSSVIPEPLPLPSAPAVPVMTPGTALPLPAQPANTPPAAAPNDAPVVKDPPIITNWGAPSSHPATDYTGLQAGASFYYIQPYFNNNVAFSTTTGLGTPKPAQTDNDFHWNYQPAYDVWLGWTAPCGLGVRFRYFHFDESAENLGSSLTPAQAATTTIAGPAGLTNLPGGNFGSPGIVLGAGLGKANLSFDSDLNLEAFDLEGTYAWKCNCFSMMLSGGARFMHMSQNYTASLKNTATVGAATITETQLLRFGHNFDGAGPTVSWFGRYEFGNTGLAAYGSVRGSLLVGSGRQDTNFSQQIVDPTGMAGGNQAINPTRSSHLDQTLPVLEVELGGEYGKNWGNSRIFVRGGVVNQTYFDGGNATTNSGNFSLFGAKFSVGINY